MTPGEALRVLWACGAIVGLDGTNVRVKIPRKTASPADVETAFETLKGRKQEAIRLLRNSFDWELRGADPYYALATEAVERIRLLGQEMPGMIKFLENAQPDLYNKLTAEMPAEIH